MKLIHSVSPSNSSQVLGASAGGFSRTLALKSREAAFELSGHPSGVYCVGQRLSRSSSGAKLFQLRTFNWGYQGLNQEYFALH